MLILGGLPAARRRNPSTVKENRRRTGPPPAKPGDDANTKSAATMASVAATPSGGSSGMDKYYSSKIGDLNSVSDGVSLFLFLNVRWNPLRRGARLSLIVNTNYSYSSLRLRLVLLHTHVPILHISPNIFSLSLYRQSLNAPLTSNVSKPGATNSMPKYACSARNSTTSKNLAPTSAR